MIYLDHNATTPIAPCVAQAYFETAQRFLGNPGSVHRFGQEARQLIVHARQQIAQFFAVLPQNLIVTSGATEALATAIWSCPPGAHLITSSLEHAAVLDAVTHSGVRVTTLDPLPGRGALTAEQIAQAIEPHTKMLVVMGGNNETGALTDMEAIAQLAREQDLLLVIDAVACIGKYPWKMPEGRVAVCMSGHKIHGPVGVGCCVFTPRFPLKPLLSGGGQQRGLRGGTESVALTVALARALECLGEPDTDARLRDRFEAGIKAFVPDVIVHCADQPRLCNVSNLAFPRAEGETLLMQLDLAGVAASHGAACQSGALELSHVLLHMGLSRDIVRRSLRFSLSRMTTEAEIDEALRRIKGLIT